MKAYHLIALVFLLACSEEKTSDNTSTKPLSRLQLKSSSFDSGTVIPDKFSCVSGAQVFPNISWNASGRSVKSYVLIMDDPDAVPVAGYVWNHWLLYDIPSTVLSIGEGSNALQPMPLGVKRGITSFGDTAYGGPCPPSGQLHHYIFKLYELDIASLGINSGASVAAVRQAMKGHLLDSATYSGTFQR